MRIQKVGVLLVSLSFIFCLSGCKDSGSNDEQVNTSKNAVEIPNNSTPEATPVDPATVAIDAPTDTSQEGNVEITDKSFGCIRDMESVRNMYVGNLLGDIEETLAVANAPEGGVYPPGSIVQVLPGEAMVKLQKGAHPLTNDWEFFVLDVAQEGSKIHKRGFEDVLSRLGGNCLSCHAQAEPQWDMVCESGHGCAPIVIPGIDDIKVLISALQKTDKRCAPDPTVQLTQDEIDLLEKLEAIMTAAAEAKIAAEAREATEAAEANRAQ
ncbi:MAG: hypothetical protein D3923_07665 [Candidatus Electrothrix sp. AR3]|nr:hypothetical protein [Candidatus Electrothrix sp. AR3]